LETWIVESALGHADLVAICTGKEKENRRGSFDGGPTFGAPEDFGSHQTQRAAKKLLGAQALIRPAQLTVMMTFPRA
jgi:hypothetical protein